MLWLFYSQALSVVSLWHTESDVGELFGSQAIDRIFRQLFELVGVGTITLLALGILLALMYIARNGGLGIDTAWTLSGIAYLILVSDCSSSCAESQPSRITNRQVELWTECKMVDHGSRIARLCSVCKHNRTPSPIP